MTHHSSTSPAGETWDRWDVADQAEELDGKEGKEAADAAYNEELQKAKTLSDLQGSVMADVKSVVEGDKEAEARAKEIESAVGEVAAGHGSMKIDHALSGTAVQGYNKGFSHDTAISSDPLTAEAVVQDTKTAKIVAEHEDSEKDGHAGQIKNVGTLIDVDGEEIAPELLYEGNVEQRTEQAYGEREGQPEKVYGEGQQLVEQIGADDVNSYLRKSGANSANDVWMQAKILEQSSLDPDQMTAKLNRVGYSEKEVDDIVQRVRGRAADLEIATAA